MISIILWDIGNVIFKSILTDDLLNYISQFSCNVNKTTKAKFSALLDHSFKNNISLDSFWFSLQSIFQLNNFDLDKVRSITWFKKNTDLIKVIKSLAIKYDIGIISDLEINGYNYLVSNCTKFYNACNSNLIFISMLDNLSKHEDGITYFNLINSKICINPENILFIDDKDIYLNYANLVGFNTIKYNISDKSSCFSSANSQLLNDLKLKGITIDHDGV